MAYLQILRPLNLLQAALAVVLTTAFLGEMGETQTLIFLILSVICINGAGNIVNDIYDFEIDLVNKPQRPLPAGKLSTKTAVFYLIALFTVGCIFALQINLTTALIAGAIATPILLIYSGWLKRLPLIGNIAVSFMLGLAFIYVGAAFDAIPLTLPMAGLAFGFTLIRELVKDLEDMEGDGEAGARTFPLVFGERAAIILITLLSITFVILDLSPYFFGTYSSVFLWIVLLGVNIPLLVACYVLFRYPDTQTYARVQLFLKLNIFVGLAALYLGRPI